MHCEEIIFIGSLHVLKQSSMYSKLPNVLFIYMMSRRHFRKWKFSFKVDTSCSTTIDNYDIWQMVSIQHTQTGRQSATEEQLTRDGTTKSCLWHSCTEFCRNVSHQENNPLESSSTWPKQQRRNCRHAMMSEIEMRYLCSIVPLTKTVLWFALSSEKNECVDRSHSEWPNHQAQNSIN